MQTVKKYAVVALVVVLAGLGVRAWMQQRLAEQKIISLHNELAAKSETIEIQKGMYEKLTYQSKDLEDALRAMEKNATTDKELIAALRKEIDKRDEEIVSAHRIALRWKKDYEALVAANQADETDPETGVVRTRVTFDNDFGYIGVSGYTLTNPAEAWMRVRQNRPLYLTVALTQTKDRRWKTYVTSSEENVAVDVEVAAVNPYIFKERWYEKISIDVGANALGLGQTMTGEMVGFAGLSVPIGPVDITAGAHVGTVGFGPFLSLKYGWKPFKRD